jgi:hypothetical protein
MTPCAAWCTRPRSEVLSGDLPEIPRIMPAFRGHRGIPAGFLSPSPGTSPALSIAMSRVLAAIFAVLALVAAGVPMAAAMPPHCTDCCRHGAMHAADAPMPDCCGLAPADRPVAREAARRTTIPPTVIVPEPSAERAGSDHVRGAGRPRQDLRRRVVRTDILRI